MATPDDTFEKEFVCPLLGSSGCDWLGPESGILKHCQKKHLCLFLDNNGIWEPDFSKSNENNYLLQALQVSFLIQVKVSLATSMLRHTVRFLCASDEVAGYSYILKISRGKKIIRKEGQVAMQDESSSLRLNTKNLLSELGTFDGATYTVVMKKACARCGEKLVALLYRGKEGWWCERCAPATRACKNEELGCCYRDISMKCRKHEEYFCEQRISCGICNEDVSGGALLAHYSSKHKDIMYKTGSTWRTAINRNGYWEKRFVSGAAGTAVCNYMLGSSKFELQVHIPVSSLQLNAFCCVVQLTDPATGNNCIFNSVARYDNSCDWHITISTTMLSSCTKELLVRVDIVKTEP